MLEETISAHESNMEPKSDALQNEIRDGPANTNRKMDEGFSEISAELSDIRARQDHHHRVLDGLKSKPLQDNFKEKSLIFPTMF